MQSAQNRAAWVAYEGLEVRFVYIDVFLEKIITVAGNKVRFWKWYSNSNKTGGASVVKMLFEIELPANIDISGGKSLINSEGFILSLDNFSLVLLAKNSDKNWVIARKFKNDSPIVDFCVTSPDGRFLIGSNTDKQIITWDIVTGQKIDVFKLPMITTSISCAKDGRFVGMTHVGQKGVSIWVNLNILEQQKFKNWDDSRIVPSKELPGLSYDMEFDDDFETDDDDFSSGSESDSESDDFETEHKFKDLQLNKNQITLSKIPENKWSALPKLDLLKAKNKAVNPKKKAALAPFFLETKKLTGGDKLNEDFEFVQGGLEDDEDQGITQKLMQNSEFINCLESDNYQDLFDLFEKYTAARIDRELRSLVIEDEKNENSGSKWLSQYLKHVLGKLKTKTDYEVCNAYLAIFLNVHEDWLLESDSGAEEINNILAEILDVLDDDVDKLSFQFDQSLTILQWLKHSIL